jgi:hypothetical protein
MMENPQWKQLLVGLYAVEEALRAGADSRESSSLKLLLLMLGVILNGLQAVKDQA